MYGLGAINWLNLKGIVVLIRCVLSPMNCMCNCGWFEMKFGVDRKMEK